MTLRRRCSCPYSMAGMIILSTAYGIDVQPENDPYVAISEKSLHAMACAGNFGAYLVDSLPLQVFASSLFCIALTAQF